MRFGNLNGGLVKVGVYELWRALAVRFSWYVAKNTISSSWKESKTILPHKKSSKEDLENYRPIRLLSHIY